MWVLLIWDGPQREWLYGVRGPFDTAEEAYDYEHAWMKVAHWVQVERIIK